MKLTYEKNYFNKDRSNLISKYPYVNINNVPKVKTINFRLNFIMFNKKKLNFLMQDHNLDISKVSYYYMMKIFNLLEDLFKLKGSISVLEYDSKLKSWKLDFRMNLKDNKRIFDFFFHIQSCLCHIERKDYSLYWNFDGKDYNFFISNVLPFLNMSHLNGNLVHPFSFKLDVGCSKYYSYYLLNGLLYDYNKISNFRNEICTFLSVKKEDINQSYHTDYASLLDLENNYLLKYV